MRHKLLLTAIVFFALCLRLYGLNWDQGQHLHPDERFLTMVVVASRIPTTFGEYLDPGRSPLNPYNNNFSFYVYGILPLTMLKIIAVVLKLDTYEMVGLLGRVISTLFDVATLVVMYRVAQLLQRRYQLGKSFVYFATLLYGIAVLPIQLSHFFTVDPFATFFTTAAIYFALCSYYHPRWRHLVMTGVFLGLALATKISTLVVGPLALALIAVAPHKQRGLSKRVLSIAVFLFIVLGVVRVGDPHAFATGNIFDLRLGPQFIANITQLSALSDSSAWYPPGVQWIGKTPLVFPLKNIMFFGLGPVFFIVLIIGVVRVVKMIVEKKSSGRVIHLDLLLLLGWSTTTFVYQGLQPVMSIRYFYLLYPFFALLAAVTLSRLSKWPAMGVLFLILIHTASFMAIYTRPHTRVTASAWIYAHIPAGSVIATEHWDDALPLSLSPDRVAQRYDIEQLPVFDQDTPEKWRSMDEILSRSDYIIFSSNRGYGSIMPVPDRYPQMSRFYQDLFAGRSNFQKVAEFTSYPTFPLFYILHSTFFVFPDQWSDEAFTVYDHPKVMIYKKQ